jgi:uncharacterized membrane-anchored protein
MLSVFGTMISDIFHWVHIPLQITSLSFALLMTLVLMIWYFTEKTLSFYSIKKGRTQLFYFSTILFAFALGTSLGDFTANVLNMGFFLSGIMFIVIIIIPCVAYLKFPPTALFHFGSLLLYQGR